MNAHHIPFRITALGLAALALLAWLPADDGVKSLLLIGWLMVFYGALAQWAASENKRELLQEIQPQPRSAGLWVDEFYDADRFALQHDDHSWEHEESAADIHQMA